MYIHIQQAEENDLEAILQLQKDCYMSEAMIYNDYEIQPLKQDLESLTKEFENSTILKAEINKEIVGSIRGYDDNKTAYIGKLIVKSDYQNKGIGKLLLNSIEQNFNSCNRFELFTGFKSQKNIYLYNKLGYKEFKQQIINNNLILIYLDKQNTSNRIGKKNLSITKK